MTRRFLLTIDLEGAHAPDAVGFLQDLADAGYVLHSAVSLEHSCGSPGASLSYLPLAEPVPAEPEHTEEPAES